MNLIGTYQNGNYLTSIFDDGTKIRETEKDIFIPNFPESFDLKITNYCNALCPMCHEGSTSYGLHGDILNPKFINTLQPYTECSAGGGNPLSHPDLLEFLQILKSKNIIANITVNQKHFLENQEFIQKLVDDKLIYGLGISVVEVNDTLIEMIQKYPNAVVHVINGIINENNLDKMYNKNLKLLILGYKEFRRGKYFYSTEVEDKKLKMYDLLPKILNKFKVVSFDNLAIKQLDVKRLLSEDKWNEFYMGDDGQYTMYIDLVENKFAKSSISEIRYDLLDNIIDMFNVVRNEILQ